MIRANVAEALSIADGIIVGRSLKTRPEMMAPIERVKRKPIWRPSDAHGFPLDNTCSIG